MPLPGVFEDGLGKRRHIVEPNGADTLELLCLRDELTAVPAFEFALRERAGRLAGFKHISFSHVRSVDRLNDPAATLAVVSEHTHGVRLSKLFATTDRQALDINAALHLIRQLVSAAALLHEHGRDIAHGAIGPERLIVTPTARLVIVEYVLGAALEQLHYSHERYWTDLRIAIPRSAGLPRFDQRADVAQIGVVALSLILGRLLRDDEYPSRVGEVLASAWAISARGGFEPLPHGLRAWLSRALQLDARTAFANAVDARDELDKVLSDDGEYEDDAEAAERTITADVAPAPIAPIAPMTPIAPVALVAEPAPEPANPWEPFTPRPHVQHAEPPKVDAPKHEAPKFEASKYEPPKYEPTKLDAPKVEAKVIEPLKRVEPVKPAESVVLPAARVETHAPRVEHFQPAKRIEPFESTFDPPEPVESLESNLELGMAKSTERRKPIGVLVGVAAALVIVAVGGAYGARRYFAPSALAATTGTLNVSSSPAGAQVFIDGVKKGLTPLSIVLNPGPHMMELQGAGEPRSLPVTITAGAQMSQYIELPKAASASGQLLVRTEPAGAQISVDDVLRGPSPVTVDDLSAGEHVVTVTSDMGTVKQRVMIAAGANASVVVPLGGGEGAPVSGWVSVSAPADVQLFENKRLLGSSQSDRIMVSAGRHEFEFVNETLGYRATKTVQVQAGKVASVKLEWPKGTIALNAIPWADVWIDGEKVGETPIGNLSVPIGSHEVVFRHPDLGEQRHAVSVTANAPARLSVDMRKK
ncbi:MAG TPA: PEGA domain-containing protein [Vicinamibacterales bacterium]